ncbi:MAG: hypothetical protein DRP74_06830 [Candidatus Omnitrophota bacterium]|nr:MAG: hypothetical protein DRP74_06830 [Candidatus Omnitrophota bacterium]
MKTLKEIKKEIQFNQELGSLVEVLKGIASAEFRQLQAKREYNTRLIACLDGMFQDMDLFKSRHPFIERRSRPRPVDKSSASAATGTSDNDVIKTSIVMITSDEGFLGELNSRVINTALRQRGEGDELVVLGERGAHILEETKESYFYFPGISDIIEYERAQSLRDYLVQRFLQKKINHVVIIYPKFISFAQQEVAVEQLLPYVLSKDRIVKEDAGTSEIVPFVFWKIEKELRILAEPSIERVTDYLIRVWMAQKIYDIFWDSKLSELSSRVIHLEGSSQTITEISKKLKYIYFSTVHQISDRNIREIFASRLKEKH